MNRVTCWLIAFVLVVSVASIASGEYVIVHETVASGGGETTGPTFTMLATPGEPVVGDASGGSFDTAVGFWYQPGWILTGVAEDATPLRYWLGQNAPNPFNPVTTLSYSVPRRTRVRITLYNAAGREVRSVVDREMDPGFHAAVVYASNLPSGVYFCRMVADTFAETRKLILLK